MCFSPEVDVVAAGAIGIAAVAALQRAEHPRTLPLAALPAVFAVHTLSSAFVWWGADGTVPAGLGDAAAQFFLTVAYVALPVLVAIAVLLLEPPGRRRNLLVILLGAGVLAAAMFAIGIWDGRGSAVACDYYIAFDVSGMPGVIGPLYFAATCGALLLSRHRPLLLWGVGNATAVAVLVLLTKDGLPSLWCFWAACTSFFVTWYLGVQRTQRRRGASWPWEEPAPQREAVLPP